MASELLIWAGSRASRLKRNSIRCSSLDVGWKVVGHHLNFDRNFTFRDEVVLSPELERWGVTSVAVFRLSLLIGPRRVPSARRSMSEKCRQATFDVQSANNGFMVNRVPCDTGH